MDTRRIALGSVLILIATSFCLIYTVRLVLLVLMIGIGIGVLLIPVVDWSRKKARLPSGITAFFLILGLIAVLFGVGYILYVIISDQLGKAVEAIPQAYDTIRDWLSHHSSIKLGSKTGLDISSALQTTFGTVIHGAELGVELGAGLFYIVSVALYVAVDPIRNQNSFLSAFPAYLRPRIKALSHESAKTLRQWFLSHLIVVVCIGLAYAIGLKVLGNSYWALFGILAAVLEFVPYIGPFTIALGASAVFLSNGQTMHVLWMVILALFIQELEGHVLLPIVMKERINLPPVQLITLAIIMGFWFGILGVFATPPLLAVLRNVYIEVYAKRMDEKTVAPLE